MKGVVFFHNFGINTLNGILPNMCKEIGIKPKTVHSLRIAFATKVFSSGVEENLFEKGPDIGQMPC